MSAQAWHDKQVAEDRLYAAWKEGAIVPPRESVTPTAPKEITLLPEKLRAFVNNWESPETRRNWRLRAGGCITTWE